MAEPQQFYLFPPATEKPARKPKKPKVVVMVPESEEIDRLKDLIERLEFALVDCACLASEYVEAAYWSKFLKRMNITLQYHDLPKILLRNNEFVFVKRRGVSELDRLNITIQHFGLPRTFIESLDIAKGRPATEQSNPELIENLNE